VAKPLAAFTGSLSHRGGASTTPSWSCTNRAPSYPYRGYGPPPHFLVLESLMDMAARKLGMDPAELRRRNYIRPEQFPYTIPSGNEYDSGNYEAVLDKAARHGRLPKCAARSSSAARAEGRYVGIGVVSTVEPGVFDWNAYATVGVPGVGVPEACNRRSTCSARSRSSSVSTCRGRASTRWRPQVVADYWFMASR
jgi:CO/xanthine dehydrogenase Mo-binding subunit